MEDIGLVLQCPTHVMMDSLLDPLVQQQELARKQELGMDLPCIAIVITFNPSSASHVFTWNPI